MHETADLVDYAMTKSAIVSFSKSLAEQLAERGIRVNAVAPGPFRTPLRPSGDQPPDMIPTFGERFPHGRPGRRPAELATTYVLLASAEARYVTYEVFGNSGGSMPY